MDEKPAEETSTAQEAETLDASLKENAQKLEELAAASGAAEPEAASGEDAPETQEVGAEEVGDLSGVLKDEEGADDAGVIDAAPEEAGDPSEPEAASEAETPEAEAEDPSEPEPVDPPEDAEPADPVMAEFMAAVASYREIMSSPVIREPQLMQGIQLHRTLTHLGLDHGREDIYQAYLDFHKEEGGFEGSTGQLMVERFALRGIQYIPAALGERISAIYTLFRAAAQGEKAPLDQDRLIELLDYGHQEIDIPQLLDFLERRTRAAS